MRSVAQPSLLLLSIVALLFTGCAATSRLTSNSHNYHVKAYKPHDPSNVVVKLSTGTQNLYVMEGDRLLMAVQSNVGKPGAETPTGHFTIYNKEKTRRRASEPDAGYPMAYWQEFKPAYGFHEGFVWPMPHTHGCVRLHKEAAARLWVLTKIGTPVIIAHSLPEDSKYGKQVQPLDQSKDPDPPRSFLMSSAWFQDPPGPLLVDE